MLNHLMTVDDAPQPPASPEPSGGDAEADAGAPPRGKGSARAGGGAAATAVAKTAASRRSSHSQRRSQSGLLPPRLERHSDGGDDFILDQLMTIDDAPQLRGDRHTVRGAARADYSPSVEAERRRRRLQYLISS